MKLLIMLATLPFLACASKPGPLGEMMIDITNFDFSTNISTILPAHYKHPVYEGLYNIPELASDDTNLMARDSVCSWETNELQWIEYRQASSSSADQYLCFDQQVFNSASFITALDGRIAVVCGSAYSISAQQSGALIERMTSKYGEPKITQESFCNKNYDLYAWTLEDRTIKFATISTDESNVMKLEIERDEQGSLINIREGVHKVRQEGYIYIIDGPWAEKICSAGEVSGDFVYCH